MTTRDLAGKTFVVTGANTGIGRTAAEGLARRGGRVLLCGRSAERTMPVVDAIRSELEYADVDFIALDLANLASVRESADQISRSESQIDVLVDNAGVAGHRGVTADGFEIQFGVNHLGHYLLTRLLLPKLISSRPARVVVLSSGNHRSATGIDFEAVQRSTDTVAGLHEYGVSKLANVMFAKQLARLHGDDGIAAYAVNPGQVATDVWRRLPWPFRQLFIALAGMKTPEQGALTTIHCATAPLSELESGGYYADCTRAEENPLANDAALAEELWDKSDGWVRPFLRA